jgi:hypothetical protein
LFKNLRFSSILSSSNAVIRDSLKLISFLFTTGKNWLSIVGFYLPGDIMFEFIELIWSFLVSNSGSIGFW